MVTSYSKLYYLCQCDKCKDIVTVEQDFGKKIYNGAQAVRSLGWLFSKDGQTVICYKCRLDNYRYVKKK